MFDTMKVVKFVGGFGGALLIFLLVNMVANALYFGGEGHGEGEEVLAYVIETEEEPAEEEAAAEEEATPEEEAAQQAAPEAEAAAPGFAALLAEADAEKGAKVFKKCKSCHKLEKGKNAVGPYLYGVVGRPVASVEGFKYSDALKGLGGEWTPERLDEFLIKPKDFAPGTKMSFAGLKKPEDRANLIAYLSTIHD